MSAILIITILLLAAASYSIIRSKRAKTLAEADDQLPPPSQRGLFGDGPDGDCRTGEFMAEHELALKTKKQLLRGRAAQGDLEALRDAHAAKDPALYREVLSALVRKSDEDAALLLKLTAFITRSDDLRASPALAEKFLEHWSQAPSAASTAELLRVAALSDDAATFEKVLNAAFDAHRAGRLRGLGAADLRALFEGEFWVLSSEAKRSGAGFVLKRQLAEVSRLLNEAPRPEAPTSSEAGEGRASL